MQPWLEKYFPQPELGTVTYVKCPDCGFVAAQTINELPPEKRSRVNQSFHSYQGGESCPIDAKWPERLEAQATVIADLAAAHLLPTAAPWLDYGSGEGNLSALLAQRSARRLLNFDAHLPRPGYVEPSALKAGAFEFVITTSVFEHLRTRAQMDEIAGLVAPDGVMGLHTMVAEEIPANPDWFYYLPVHCAFFTNASMQRLFEAWGFRSSIYHVRSRLWFWFKADPATVENAVAALNARGATPADAYHFKRGFMDYWKLKPAEVMQRRSLNAA
jgi:hypothetical protein